MEPFELRRRMHSVAALLVALPFLTAADGNGCGAGGTIPIGSGATGDGGGDAANACSPADCAGLPMLGLAKSCPDGTGLGATDCTRQASGACGWGFPPCPGTTDASAPARCPLRSSPYDH